MEEMLSEMMRQQITQTAFMACKVENRRYTDEEYKALTHVQKFKLSMLRDRDDCPIGSYDSSQKGKFPDGYFNRENWPTGDQCDMP